MVGPLSFRRVGACVGIWQTALLERYCDRHRRDAVHGTLVFSTAMQRLRSEGCDRCIHADWRQAVVDLGHRRWSNGGNPRYCCLRELLINSANSALAKLRCDIGVLSLDSV